MKKINFEDTMKELQDVVDKLEKGNLTLDDSLDEFQKGIRLSKLCSKKLDDIEKKITILVEKQNGEIEEQVFLTEGDDNNDI